MSAPGEQSDYRAVFEGAPLAMWDEDFSAIRAWFDELAASGVSDIRGYLNANPGAVLHCVRLLRVRHVNRAAREFYGAASGTEVIDNLASLFDEAALRIFREELSHFAEGGDSFQSEVSALTLSGEQRLVQMNVALLPTPDQPWSRVVVTFTDVMERRKLEKSLVHANHTLRQVNADLEQFTWAAAHDLREPLRTIGLYAELLHRSGIETLGERQTTALAYIKDGAARMESLIADLLAFARAIETPEDVSLASADAATALSDALAALAAAVHESRAQVATAALPCVKMDGLRLTQVFQNLIGNAIKYRSPDRRPEICITAEEKEQEAVFCIADNGRGIAPEYHDRIFGVFRRLHGKEIQGNGLGLALCRRMLEHYGGRIWVESELGEGAKFYFSLPVNGRSNS